MDNGDREVKISQRAYELWYGQGCPSGRDQEHWEQACREMEEAEAGSAVMEASGARQKKR